MAASIVARKQLARVLLSSSLRSTRPSTLPAASRSYNKYAAEDSVDDPFYVVCGPGPESQKPGCFPLHHEYLVRNRRDGYHVKLYMAGVGKGNVRIWIEGNELIAEGIKGMYMAAEVIKEMYMAGLGKGNVKIWIEGNELIVEGIKEKDYEDEDDNHTNTLFRYRMFGPDNKHFNLDAIRAEINNGILKVFAPRRDPNKFNPKER